MVCEEELKVIMTCKTCGKPIEIGDYCSLKCKDTKKRAVLKSTKAKGK
jgi:hypothetical protein